jgi:hypothetical protein
VQDGIVHTGTSDTDPDVLRLQADLLRRATPARRLQLALSLSASVIGLACAGICRRSPGISDDDARLQFVEIHYGAELAQELRARLLADRHT